MTNDSNTEVIEIALITVALTSTWQNPTNPLDVNEDGEVAPIDVLIIINDLNAKGPRTLPAEGPEELDSYLDVNGDGHVSPLDALLIINDLNSVFNSMQLEGEANAQLQRAANSVWSTTLKSETEKSTDWDAAVRVMYPSSKRQFQTTQSTLDRSFAVRGNCASDEVSVLLSHPNDGEYRFSSCP